MKNYSNFLVAIAISFTTWVTVIPEKSLAHGFIITDEPVIIHHPPRPPNTPFPSPPRPIHRVAVMPIASSMLGGASLHRLPES